MMLMRGEGVQRAGALLLHGAHQRGAPAAQRASASDARRAR